MYHKTDSLQESDYQLGSVSSKRKEVISNDLMHQQSAVNSGYPRKIRNNCDKIDDMQYDFLENPSQEDPLSQQNQENADYIEYEYLESDFEEDLNLACSQNYPKEKRFYDVESEETDENSSCHNTFNEKISHFHDSHLKNLSATKKYDCWNYNETLALIQSYASHVDELDHPVLRKKIWENVSNDLTSQKYCFDKKQCQTKWNNLLRTYKTCKDKSGRAPIRFMFFEAMDEIIGTKPSNSSSHTISSLKKKIDLNKDTENDKNSCNENDNHHKEEVKQLDHNNKILNNDSEKVKDDKSSKGKKKYLKKTDIEKMKLRETKNKLLSDLLEIEKTKCELMKKYLANKARL